MYIRYTMSGNFHCAAGTANWGRTHRQALPMQPTSSIPGSRALILGATGGIGGEVARQMLATGWQVQALHRTPPAGTHSGIHWHRGDAMQADDVERAAHGCTVIVHAVNPPAYRDWDRQVLPMIDNTIAAARRTGARIVLPDTVYNYGPDSFPLVGEQAPQHPLTAYGRIRVRLEQRLETAAQQGIASLTLRSGDFFGPRAGSSWFSQGLLKLGRTPQRILYPGTPGIGHSWAYLPDVAATLQALLSRREGLPAHACFHMAGHWDPDGRQMVETIQRVLAAHDLVVPIRRFPWGLLGLAAPFNETLRQLRHMRYLWRQPLQLDNRLLRQTLGEEPHTPWTEAVTHTLQGLACLPSQAGAAV